MIKPRLRCLTSSFENKLEKPNINGRFDLAWMAYYNGFLVLGDTAILEWQDVLTEDSQIHFLTKWPKFEDFNYNIFEVL